MNDLRFLNGWLRLQLFVLVLADLGGRLSLLLGYFIGLCSLQGGVVVRAIGHYKAALQEFFRALALDVVADHVSQLELCLLDSRQIDFDLTFTIEVVVRGDSARGFPG